MTYTSKFMTETITDLDPVAQPMSEAVGYNPTTLTHTVYSEDFGLIGTRSYTMQAYLLLYTQVVSLVSTAQIDFIDPC